MQRTRARGWQFWIDRGGTFTDVVGVSPRGEVHIRKVLSAQAAGMDVLAAVRGKETVELVRVGTTVATNALLERKGEPVALVTTAGFADALHIGYQNRPDIFARHIVLADRLYGHVIEARERVDVAGNVLEPLDIAALRTELQKIAGTFRSVAIVFMHGWQHTTHERAAAALAREMGFVHVSASHELSPLVRFVARGDTTVLNAYLAPPLQRYVDGMQRELSSLDATAQLELMQSNGGLAAAESFHAMSSVLSGPAGGLIGMAHVGNALGITRLIGFDMGGTSTDVSLFDGELPRRFENLIAGVRLQSPMLDVHTIAAGGGSILRFDDGRFSVGPESAGADPGPACYGRGGPLTLTDAQVALGRLRADTLPKVFGHDGKRAIDPNAVTRLFGELGARVRLPVEALAEAFLEVAVESMANAIRQVSTRQGLDAGDFALFCFGGAAGQHACRVARAAGMRRILVHPLASVLSAFGIGVADRLALRRASLRLPLSESALAVARANLEKLEAEARTELSSDGVRVEYVLELRAGDSETNLPAPFAPLAQVMETFAAAHRKRFGFEPSGVEPVIEAIRVEARAPATHPSPKYASAPLARSLPATARVYLGEWREVPLIEAARLEGEIAGPALIVEPHSTTVLEPGWRAKRLPGGELLLESDAHAPATVGLADPARIEIFNNLFMHIAEQMGEVLKATAQSVNIKERLDYSCALFDASGGLVANAPHMPVHLGSMGASVRAVIDACAGRMPRGNSWLLNSPYRGGTHLPDMTVVTPVFLSEQARPDFFVASRAHHADIGGVTPGSMPPSSAHIDEEGVVFEHFTLVENGRFLETELRNALASARYPARNPDQNVADLRAQLAANARGIAEIERAVKRHSLGTVRDYMHHVQANAAECVRNAIGQLKPASYEYEMDDGQRIVVRVDIDHARRAARIDFTGTSAQGAHNFNAPRAICIAAVLYVFRTLVERPIPLNEGCLEPLEILVPAGSMLDPSPPAAVAAGNVETSQCIVDALYGALGVLAASQGTMNNLTFGDGSLQYYETIAGGAGAGPGFDGCDAVQTHMTNSRLTDPEILESKFPVLLREFSIRHGSGGAGQYRGGNGTIRRIEFRASLSGALLSNHRRIAPFGLAGGSPGALGSGRIVRTSGAIEVLGATAFFHIETGDVLEILTPGGGGFGTGRWT